jgi:hypothetical protein
MGGAIAAVAHGIRDGRKAAAIHVRPQRGTPARIGRAGA